jgi:nucleotide-binding universal stress UspA family protein
MKILVGYDGSDAAMDALKEAQRHAKVMNAKLEVVYAITRFDPMDFDKVQDTEYKFEHEVKEVINGDGLAYETHLLLNDSSAGDQLVAFAESYHVAEIIIGVRRRSKAGKFAFGSTAQHVILNAPCPVVTVR